MSTQNYFVAVRLDGELDTIIFTSLTEAHAFEEKHPEYHIIETGVYSLQEALDIFS